MVTVYMQTLLVPKFLLTPSMIRDTTERLLAAESPHTRFTTAIRLSKQPSRGALHARLTASALNLRPGGARHHAPSRDVILHAHHYRSRASPALRHGRTRLRALCPPCPSAGSLAQPP